jgi:hypothetical protein
MGDCVRATPPADPGIDGRLFRVTAAARRPAGRSPIAASGSVGGVGTVGVVPSDWQRLSRLCRPTARRTATPHAWRASINACELGVYPDRDTAMKRVAEIIESEMGSVLRDWEILHGVEERKINEAANRRA